MKCPHLIKWLSYCCKANEKPYFPSPFQLEEYCKGKYYRKCPFLIKVGYGREMERLISTTHC
jgi:hypothetical protein